MKYTPLGTPEIDKISGLVKQAIGYDQKRGDEVSVSNFQFTNVKVGGDTGIKAIMNEYGYILGPAGEAMKYVIAAVLLFALYNRVIAPFAQRMMEIPVEDEAKKPKEFTFDEEELEDTHGKLQEMRKKVEQQLGITGPLNEDSLKYDVMLEKIKTSTEEHIEEIASLFETLVADEAASQSPLGSYRKDSGL